MAERSSPPRKRVGDKFIKKMSLYGKRQTFRDPQSQSVLEHYKGHPKKSQKKIGYNKLGYLERILHDDAQRSNETRLPRWELKKSLGQGAYGVVTMWERYMGPDQEPLRLACKQASFDAWFQDLCEEAQLTRKLVEAGCVNVVKVIDWVVNSDVGRSRIQYEYCPHGTLSAFTSYYYKPCGVTMPEAMIWHVFHSLATAVCYHAHGTTAEEPIAGWKEIIHRDIKPHNVLMAEPDPNNRPLYPTVKLADYGLAYTVDSENIRNLKTKLWGGGTIPFAAPEVMSTVRLDPAQTPHEKVYPETDIFSVGCIILQMMRQPFYRYHSYSMELIDYEFPLPFNSVPYSDILRDLAMDCVRLDVRTRPRVRDVYKRTKYYADLWYGKIGGPGVGKSGEAYAGQVLWNKDLRNRFETDMDFRWNYTIHNDWFYNHPDSVAKLHRTAIDPGKANVPRGDLVAIGNGFAHEAELSGPPGQTLLPETIKSFQVSVFNREGKLLQRRDGKEVRRVSRPQYFPPKLDEAWKEKRLQLLKTLIDELSRKGRLTDAETKALIRCGKEVVAMEFDTPTAATLHRLRDLKRVRDAFHMRDYGRNVRLIIQDFAGKMIDYLNCQTDTQPRFTPFDQDESYHSVGI